MMMNAFTRTTLMKKYGIHVSQPGLSSQILVTTPNNGEYHFVNQEDADRFMSNLLVSLRSTNPISSPANSNPITQKLH